MLWKILFLAFVVATIVLQIVVANELSEDDRVEEYYKRGYEWPIREYVPNTAGWRELMEERFRQVQEIDDLDQRYEGYIQTISSALLIPNFTEFGFGLARCPQDLLEALQSGIRDGFETKTLEHPVDVIEGPRAWFIHRGDLARRVLLELKHYAETWAQGLDLVPVLAYGFRLYRNESILHMHVDRTQTHVISFILHIDSSDDSEPWPIFIEDLFGRTHEVVLTPGDMLFYESSKCFHGRPKPFHGTWYSSVFVHYYPAGWQQVDHKLENHYAVPPHWADPSDPIKHETTLVMRGTSLTEPDCPNQWCRSLNSIKWSGPGQEGFWIAPNGEKYPFHPPKGDYNEEL